MADAGVDIAQLTEDQQLALQQFTAVTDQDIKDAVPLLRRCQWNVQVPSTHPSQSLVIPTNVR
jgi:FAS-associated factor 2